MRKYPPLEDMKASGRILTEALELAAVATKPGVSTKAVDRVVHDFILSTGATAAFLGYDGFPACCCISVNDTVVHGVPSEYLLKDGDIVSVDCGVVFNGAITDACRTLTVGEVSYEDLRLIKTTEECLLDGIEKAIVGNQVGDISFAIQKRAESAGYSVSRDFIGHSIGYELHLPPWIPSYGKRGVGDILYEGMFVAIEPVVFMGSWRYEQRGRWNIVAADNKKTAHCEDTVYISNLGPIILTR